eukprot:GFYU01017374.1.p1 GENE.GFYU01017374.1~~GFYU01017374.1.p1  ORF type:complete len:168 (+),score=15.11 GFYU01017374.1:56-505(+)
MPDLRKELPALIALEQRFADNLTPRDAHTLLEDAIPNAAQRGFLLSTIDFQQTPHPMWITDVPVIHRSMPQLEWDLPEGSTYEHDNEVPVCFIMGETSPYNTDARAAEHVSLAFPQANRVVIPKAGHWVHVEQRDAFVTAVEMFVEALH